MAVILPFVALAVLVVATVSVYSAVHVVEEGDLEALLVFGEMQAVLEPGLNVVPPFVSKTYSIDPTTMTMDRGDDRVSIPDEFETEVRDRRSSRKDDSDVEFGSSP